jgi:hypothetical protein
MHRRLRAHAAVALIAACTAPSLGAFSGFANSLAFGAGSQSDNDNSAKFDLETESENLVGGHGYAEVSLDFAAGKITGRNHACVGPTQPTLNDNASGECRAFASEEQLTITSDTLPLGTPVMIKLCVDMSSQIAGIATPKPRIGASESTTALGFSTILGQNFVGSFVGRHETERYWEDLTGFGVFTGQNTEIVTFRGSITVQVLVGDVLLLNANGTSSTVAAASSAPGEFPIADGSAGFAMTFGLESITDGAHLSWNGANWTGSCDPSLPLIPDNPVPAPSATLLLCAAAVAPCARRRR